MVSVIIPAYNAAATIRRAIDSVVAQTVAVREIIVIDDGSPDDLADVVTNAYGSEVILIREPNRGVSNARNAGIAKSTGEFIAFLDADDFWEPDKIERQLAVFRRCPEVGLVAGRHWIRDFDGKTDVAPLPRLVDCEKPFRYRGAAAFLHAIMIWTGTVIVRRSALNVERFDPEFTLGQDVDLWMRLVLCHTTYLLSHPTATCVLDRSSSSRRSVTRECMFHLKLVERYRKTIGSLAARQWSARIWMHMSMGSTSTLSALARLFKSMILWPLPLPVTIMPNAAPMLRLRRLAALLLLRACTSDQSPHR